MARRRPINGPTPAAPLVGLLASARVVTDETYDVWANGIAYEPEGCAGAGRTASSACGPGARDPRNVADVNPGAAVVEFDPFDVWTADRCTAMEFRTREFERRATNALAACAPVQIEAELWNGAAIRAAIAAGEDHPNLYLSNADGPNFADLSDGDASPAPYALTALQEHAAARCGSSRPMIHCTLGTLNVWLDHGLVRREGRVWLDAFDNVVVPGAGYDGTGPDGLVETDPAIVWAYVTGLVEVRRGPVVLNPPAGSYGEALDRATNTIEWRASQQALASWDGCLHGAIRVDLCTQDCGPMLAVS